MALLQHHVMNDDHGDIQGPTRTEKQAPEHRRTNRPVTDHKDIGLPVIVEYYSSDFQSTYNNDEDIDGAVAADDDDDADDCCLVSRQNTRLQSGRAAC